MAGLGDGTLPRLELTRDCVREFHRLQFVIDAVDDINGRKLRDKSTQAVSSAAIQMPCVRNRSLSV
jgi:hypothetical protein